MALFEQKTFFKGHVGTNLKSTADDDDDDDDDEGRLLTDCNHSVRNTLIVVDQPLSIHDKLPTSTQPL